MALQKRRAVTIVTAGSVWTIRALEEALEEAPAIEPFEEALEEATAPTIRHEPFPHTYACPLFCNVHQLATGTVFQVAVLAAAGPSDPTPRFPPPPAFQCLSSLVAASQSGSMAYGARPWAFSLCMGQLQM
jgi:hypothetical protein